MGKWLYWQMYIAIYSQIQSHSFFAKNYSLKYSQMNEVTLRSFKGVTADSQLNISSQCHSYDTECEWDYVSKGITDRRKEMLLSLHVLFESLLF